jgi:protein YIPF5/7
MIALMHPENSFDFWTACSVLGYCLLPVIGLAVLAIALRLDGWLGLILSSLAIIWATLSATRLIDAKIQLIEQYWLVFYPVMLLYSCFVLITIF